MDSAQVWFEWIHSREESTSSIHSSIWIIMVESFSSSEITTTLSWSINIDTSTRWYHRWMSRLFITTTIEIFRLDGGGIIVIIIFIIIIPINIELISFNEWWFNSSWWSQWSWYYSWLTQHESLTWSIDRNNICRRIISLSLSSPSQFTRIIHL